jgi:peptide-methionine (S)-S-oxide reductase
MRKVLLLWPWVIAILLCVGAQDPGKKPDPASPSAPKEAEKTAKQGSPEKPPEGPKLESAVLGGGCFWCLDAVYRRIPGVKNVICGYAGGHTSRPTYPMVQTGITGHAEVVQVVYDPQVISYEQILEVFWHAHDPTTLNAQGPDIGDEYRSIILAVDEAQMKAAKRSMFEVQKSIPVPIVTQVEPLTKFWKAEPYHQNYYRRHGAQEYCQEYIAPKLRKLGLRP